LELESHAKTPAGEKRNSLCDGIPRFGGCAACGARETIHRVPGANATHPSANVQGQFLGGVSLSVIQDLGIPTGAKIFGYSLCGADVPANANLVDFNSFPTNTNSGSAGGIDLLAYNGVLYHMVPGNPGPITDWARPANGNFSDPTNWTGKATPTNTDTAIVDGNGSQWNNSGSLDELGHDSAVVNAGVSVDWTKTISTCVSYDGQLGRDRYDSNGVSGGIQFAF
jgi:hypothetical protein